MKTRKALPILLTFAAVAPAWSQHKDSIKIHFTYDSFGVRARPSPDSGSTTRVDRTLILSGNGIVALGTNKTDTNTANVNAKMTFRTVQRVPGGVSDKFRIAGPNKLVGIFNTPQNQQIYTILVTGKTCTLSIVNRLKPGFKEYIQWSASLNSLAFYSQVQTTNTTCAIE